jgi:hypothetical protein
MRPIIIFLLLTSCFALTACDTSVNVDATANVPARYSNVRVTVKELWVNESATASPDDATWSKFPLSTPVTLDLVGLDGGALNEFATQLKVSPGEYHQMRLFLADRGEALTSSAQSAGATYNNEVVYFDANNTQSTLPLELANPAQGIGIETDLVVRAADDAILAALATNPGTTTPTNFTGTPTNTDLTGTPTNTDLTGTPTNTDLTATPSTNTTTPITTTNPTTGTTPTTTTTTPGTSVPTGGTDVVTAHGLLVFDGARDLTQFVFSGQPGFLLNPSLSAFDAKKVGTIQGQVDVSQLTFNTGTGRPDVEVTAEMLNADSTRRIEVASAPLAADGTFVLYPLPLDSSKNTTTFDLVIHGPAVFTTVIRQVPVTQGAPASGAGVALGTITLTPSSSYAANVAAGASASPRGARIGFYQTLPDDNAPYLIEQQPVDPISGQFAMNAALPSAGTIVFGTFGASLLAAAPQEGASRYSVAAISPFYGDGAFSDTPVAPPAVATDTATFTVPAISVPSTSGSGTISAQVSAATPGKYDKGALLVTHDGAVIAAVPLDAALVGSATSSTVSIPGIPASNSATFDEGLYYVDAWVWNSANPGSTFNRQPVNAAVDLRNALTANTTVTIN